MLSMAALNFDTPIYTGPEHILLTIINLRPVGLVLDPLCNFRSGCIMQELEGERCFCIIIGIF